MAFTLEILCMGMEHRFAFITQDCAFFLPPFPQLGKLRGNLHNFLLNYDQIFQISLGYYGVTALLHK